MYAICIFRDGTAESKQMFKASAHRPQTASLFRITGKLTDERGSYIIHLNMIGEIKR